MSTLKGATGNSLLQFLVETLEKEFPETKQIVCELASLKMAQKSRFEDIDADSNKLNEEIKALRDIGEKYLVSLDPKNPKQIDNEPKARTIGEGQERLQTLKDQRLKEIQMDSFYQLLTVRPSPAPSYPM